MTPFYLGRLKVDNYNIREAVCFLADRINTPPNISTFVTYLNAYIFCLGYRNRRLMEIINCAAMVIADGISIRDAAFISKRKVIRRCIMTKVFDEFLITENIKPCEAILIGTTEPEVRKAADTINRVSKNLKITDAYHGYLDENTMLEILKKHENIDLVLIGMSSPKSEYISWHACSINRRAIVWHIGGGTIKCYAGTKKRAPEWMSGIGIEWIHRFIYERNTRMRYLLYNPLFVIIISLQLLKNLLRRIKELIKTRP